MSLAAALRACALATAFALATLPAAAASVIKIGTPNVPVGLGNPYRPAAAPASYTLSAMFEALTLIDSDSGEILPALATAWEAESPTVWRFALRPGVTFSNGAPFTAAAVVGSLAIVQAKPQGSEMLADEFASITKAEARDDLTIVFTLSRPEPLLPRIVSLLPIVDPKAFAALGPEAFAKAPVGTGPYRLLTWAPDRLVLEAHPGAWRKAPSERLEIAVVPDATARLQAVLSGALDATIAIEPADIQALKAIGGGVSRTSMESALGLSLRQTGDANPALKDERVRQALNYAVNKQAITALLLAGATQPSGQPAPRGSVGYDPETAPYPFDPQKAKSLLQEAGYAKGLTLTLETLLGVSMADGAVYQQVAADLAAVGVTLRIAPIAPAQFSRNWFSGQWKGDAYTATFAAYPTGDALRTLRFASCGFPGTFFCDPAVDTQIAEAAAATDPATREDRTRALMRTYHARAVALFLYDGVRLMGRGPRLAQFEATSTRIRWDRVALTAEAARR